MGAPKNHQTAKNGGNGPSSHSARGGGGRELVLLGCGDPAGSVGIGERTKIDGGRKGKNKGGSSRRARGDTTKGNGGGDGTRRLFSDVTLPPRVGIMAFKQFWGGKSAGKRGGWGN